MPNYDDELSDLEVGIRRLKTEYDIFFHGNRKKPPEDLKGRVEHLVKKMSEVANMSVAQRFRYNTLVTRFYVLRDHWRRGIVAKEAGIRPGHQRADVAEKATVTEAPGLRVSFTDPVNEEAKVRQLYDYFLKVQGDKEQKPIMPYQQFARYIETKARDLRKKHGSASVVFQISLDDDKLKFTARAEDKP
jgi:hypothetical protein